MAISITLHEQVRWQQLQELMYAATLLLTLRKHDTAQRAYLLDIREGEMQARMAKVAQSGFLVAHPEHKGLYDAVLQLREALLKLHSVETQLFKEVLDLDPIMVDLESRVSSNIISALVKPRASVKTSLTRFVLQAASGVPRRPVGAQPIRKKLHKDSPPGKGRHMTRERTR